MPGVLGCGEHRVYLQERGGGTVLAELPWDRVNYNRILETVTDARVDIGERGLEDEDCCWALSMVQAWEHEISIWRDDSEVWVGPVGDPVYSLDGVIIPARDLFEWFERRRIPSDFDFNAVDLGEIFESYALDALSQDVSPNITVTVSPVGVLGDRTIRAVDRRRSADAMREIARSALDWTMIARELRAGGEEVPGTTLLRLTDFDLRDPQLTIQGLDAATEVSVVGRPPDGSDQPIVADAGGVDAVLGLVQQTINESAVEDQNSADAAAEAYLEQLQNVPGRLETGLSAEARVGFEDLVPGALADVRIDLACRRVIETLRLHDVGVTATHPRGGGETEDVQATFVATGTTDLGS